MSITFGEREGQNGYVTRSQVTVGHATLGHAWSRGFWPREVTLLYVMIGRAI